jgi:signal peptidase I
MKGNVLRTAAKAVCVISECLIIFSFLFYACKLYTSESEPGILGITPLVVLSDSMYPAVKAGDLIMVRDGGDEEYKEGDIIAFYDKEGSDPMIITHRIIEVRQSEDGTVSYMTQGDSNNSPDQDMVVRSNVIGRLCCRVGGIGKVILKIKDFIPWICAVLGILIILSASVLRPHEDKEYENT